MVEARPTLCVAILGEEEEAAAEAAGFARRGRAVRSPAPPHIVAGADDRCSTATAAAPDAPVVRARARWGEARCAPPPGRSRGEVALLGDAALLRAAPGHGSPPRGALPILDALHKADALVVIGDDALRGRPRRARGAPGTRRDARGADARPRTTVVLPRCAEGARTRSWPRSFAGSEHAARDLRSSPTWRSFRGRRVLITGGLGFIGSNLARALVEPAHASRSSTRLMPTYGGNLGNVAGIADAVEVNVLDVRDTDGCTRYLREQDFLFNLAGQTSHLDSMSDPQTDLEINCRAQLSLLEACRRDNPGRADRLRGHAPDLRASRATCPVDEEHPIDPVDVNGINKPAGEWYHLLYGRVYGLPVTVLRLTNTYGPRMRVSDARQTFLGVWIRQVLAGEEIARVRRRHAAARLHLRRRRRSRALPGGDVAGRASARSSTSAARRTSPRGASPAARATRRLGRYRLVPFPEDRQVDRHRRLLRRRPEARERRSAGSRASALEEGLAATLDYYREHGERYWADA